jgi:HAD superfamily hydrolase (TIGR01484 family)
MTVKTALLATDFDGTLCRGTDKGYRVSDEDKNALASFRAAGGVFGVVTGRGAASIRGALENNGVSPDFVVANNGGVIMDAGMNIVASTHVPGGVLTELAPMLRRHGCPYIIVQRDNEEQHWMQDGYNIWESFTQVSTGTGSVEETTAFIPEIHAFLGRYVTAHPNGNCIDITAAGVSKATGVADVCKRFGVPLDRAWTVGDNLNDLPMVAAYNGYAMERSPEGLKTSARGIVKTIAELIEIIGICG